MSVVLLLAVCWVVRVAQLWLRGRSSRPSGATPIHTMAVLGSGGHTAEMLALLRTLPRTDYCPRDYVLAQSDHTSAERIEAFEAERRAADERANAADFRLLRLPRAREVGQSYWSSVLTTLHALFHAMVLVGRARPSLLLCNGPGTCIPICACAYALRLLGIRHVTIVYVESIARVTTLSLSGKILVHVADQFLVQWPQLAQRYPRARYIGRVA